jgi:chromate transporter
LAIQIQYEIKLDLDNKLVIIENRTLEEFKESKAIKAALAGMRPILVALILKATIDLAKEYYLDLKSIIIATIIGIVLFKKNINPILAIVISGLLGLMFYL